MAAEEEKFSSDWGVIDDGVVVDTNNNNSNAEAASTNSTGNVAATPLPPTPLGLSTRLPPLSDGKFRLGGVSTTTPRVLLSTPIAGTPLVGENTGDNDFEEIMREKNRVRREKEEYHMAALNVQIRRLEDALAAETRRRVDATTSLDEMARTEVYEMEKRLRQQLEEEHKEVKERLDTLEERVRAIEEKFIKDSNDQMESVQNKAADLGKALQSIIENQEAERKARLKREGNLLQQVEQHAKEFEERWTQERNDRIQRIGEVEDKVIRHEARLAMEQKKFEEKVEAELNSLKEELAEEVEERQAQDEEIVAALNRYTQQLQHSLSILSSD